MAPANQKGRLSKVVRVGTRGVKRAALSKVGSESNKVMKLSRRDVSQQPDKPDMLVTVDDDAFMIDAHVSKENKASATTMSTRRVVKPRKPNGASCSDDKTTYCIQKEESPTTPDDDVNNASNGKSTQLLDEESL